MTDASYFDALYADRDDPWDLASSDYERRKLELVLAALPRQRYGAAFEPGCAIGVTTRALADRCERLVAMDAAPAAVRRARQRVHGLDHVTVLLGRVPEDWPPELFELMMLSELLYYLDGPSRLAVADRVSETLAPGGDLVAVHWRHPFQEAPVNGDQVHAELADRLVAAGLETLTSHVEEDFRLDCYRMPAGPGVRAGGTG